MRLSGLRVKSVKSFDSLAGIDLTGLNLFYGGNSSGKSSVIQCLMLLKQSHQRALSTDPGVLEFRGSVDLGGFRTFVHDHDLSKTIRIGLDLNNVAAGVVPLLKNDIKLDLEFGLLNPQDREPHVRRVTIDDGNLIRFSWDEELNGLRLSDAASSSSLVNRYVDLLKKLSSRETVPFKIPDETDKRWLREWARKHACSLNGWLPYWPPAMYGPGKAGRPFGGSLNSPRNQQLQTFLWWWQSWVVGFTAQLNTFLNSFTYIGPLRAFPRRVATESAESTALGVRGERLVLYLARKPDIVKRINSTFKNMEIPYILSVDNLRSSKTQDALGDVAVAVLRDTRTGIDVSPADVGFGLSQVLPVLVQLLATTDGVVIIEQPEIHLHPRLQSRLADLMLQSVQQNRNQLVIETHSEHLLYRLQRRMREAKAPGRISRRVGVHYVACESGKSTVSQVRLNLRGEMLDPWPDDFFEERFDDLFASL